MPFLPPNQQRQSTEDKTCLLTYLFSLGHILTEQLDWKFRDGPSRFITIFRRETKQLFFGEVQSSLFLIYFSLQTVGVVFRRDLV